MIKGRAHVTFSQLESKWPLLGWPLSGEGGCINKIKVDTVTKSRIYESFDRKIKMEHLVCSQFAAFEFLQEREPAFFFDVFSSQIGDSFNLKILGKSKFKIIFKLVDVSQTPLLQVATVGSNTVFPLRR